MADTYSGCYLALPLEDKMPKITKDNIDEYMAKTKILWGKDCCK